MNSRRLAVWAFQPNRPMRPSARRLTRPFTLGQPGCRRRAAASITASGIVSIKAMPKSGVGIALRSSQLDCAVPAKHPLAPHPIVGVGAVAVQHDAGRIAKAGVNAHELGEHRPGGPARPRGRLRHVAALKPGAVGSVTERERVVKETRIRQRVAPARYRRDDLDILIRGAAAARAPLMMAAGTRPLVKNRPRPSPPGTAIVGHPLADEELPA